MNDWIGLGILLLFLVLAVVGLRRLSRPRLRTAEEFEKSAVENTTMSGALFNALHEVTDPAASRSKEVRMQVKDGTYSRKKQEGKAGGSIDAGPDGMDTDGGGE